MSRFGDSNIDELDEAILALYPEWRWDDAAPMPTSFWQDGGPLLELEGVGFEKSYATQGWDGRGAIWRAMCRTQLGEQVTAIGETMLIAGMRAILELKHGCQRCGGAMAPGVAMGQTATGSPDELGGDVVTMSPGGPGKLIDCMKFAACGHSVSR